MKIEKCKLQIVRPTPRIATGPDRNMLQVDPPQVLRGLQFANCNFFSSSTVGFVWAG
jgi:hypothetical protein